MTQNGRQWFNAAMAEQFRKLYDIVDSLDRRRLTEDAPPVNGLVEQAEETVRIVDALERSQTTDPLPLAAELAGVMRTALALAKRYGIEDLLDTAIDGDHLRLTGGQPVKPVRKAICYIIRGGRLLVFRHVDHSTEEVGIQVPAGTVRAGESPSDAALREAREETGLAGFTLVGKVGEAVFDARPYATEVHHRHFFHLEPTGDVPQRWLSTENHDGIGEPTRFECFWIPLAHAHVLQSAQSQLIGRVSPLPGTGRSPAVPARRAQPDRYRHSDTAARWMRHGELHRIGSLTCPFYDACFRARSRPCSRP